jgi:hypothetical protein
VNSPFTGKLTEKRIENIIIRQIRFKKSGIIFGKDETLI